MKTVLFTLLFSVTTFAFASEEPSYCQLQNFLKSEIPLPLSKKENKKLKRAHAFKLGATTLIGLAVGDSKTPYTEKLSQTISPSAEQEKFCTWYFADKNKSAMESFISHPIMNPFKIPVSKAAEIFMGAVKSSFFEDGNRSFLSCAKDHRYIAMGCNEQKHRGPTSFGMLLSFSGCTPEHSANIVNEVWGLNGLKAEVRMEAIKAAYNYGTLNSSERELLAREFETL